MKMRNDVFGTPHLGKILKVKDIDIRNLRVVVGTPQTMISEEGPRKEEKHNNMSNRSRETDKDLH